MSKHYLTLKEKLEVVTMFLSRSGKLWVRFKVSFVFSLIAMFATIAIFFFFGIGFNVTVPPDASVKYGGAEFFSFVLIGLAFNQYTVIAIGDYLRTIRGAYFSNWLEMILSSPMRLKTFFVSVMSWGYLYSTINIILYLLVGVWLFGAEITFPAGWYVIILILFLVIISLSGIGLMAASMFLLAGAKGEVEPISWFVPTIAALVSGVYYPVEGLPYAMQIVSKAFPQTYALEGIRLVLLGGENIWNSTVQLDILVLIIFCLILLPIGAIMFEWGISKAEREGTLARWA